MLEQIVDEIKLGSFLTATALLIAILTFWIQLWESTRKMYKLKTNSWRRDDKEEEVNREFIPGLGVVWTYIAILFALAAFAIAGWVCFIQKNSNNIPPQAIACLATAFFMTVLNVLGSLGSTFFLKLLPGKSLSEPPFEISEGWQKCLYWVAWVLALCGLGFVSFWVAGILPCSYLWIGIGLLGAALICVLIQMDISIEWKWRRCWAYVRWSLWERKFWERRVRKHLNENQRS